ncbi:unnamed protein product, partial [marine sediment metagenome]
VEVDLDVDNLEKEVIKVQRRTKHLLSPLFTK